MSLTVDHRSRSAAAAEDDGADQIGFDTPRSGVATPQPDLHDKRLPGIMSYFGQVRTDSIHNSVSAPVASDSMRGPSISGPSAEEVEKPGETFLVSSTVPAAPCGDSEPTSPSAPCPGAPLSSKHTASKALASTHQYPTPPLSRRSSMGRPKRSLSLFYGDGRSAASSARPLLQHSSSDFPTKKCRSLTLMSQPSSMVTTSVVHAHHISNPSLPNPTTSMYPAHSQIGSAQEAALFDKSSSLDQLRRLTQVAGIKSGPPTPTRALSAAQPSQEERSSSKRSSNETVPPSGTQTPRGSTGAQVPAARGKLTIKIIEAKGLRRSRDPYVVAVFQRSELISGGPQSFEDEGDLLPAPSFGGIPIQRQGSDSGRPAMSIPMRSRQSSNTSISDYNTFRNKSRRTFTCPKWDAEAEFDVVESNMLVDISVYDHTANGEEFLGHVDFQANRDSSNPANFQGFTFVDESALDDHMRDKNRYDDEEMHDSRNHDDDWDDLEDMNHRGNRMSGIVRTTTNDEQMVGGGHFDV
ncbi:hypothetical protein CMUS01_03486 [Colletotrichum musicola]|uniref:C2 domain-containing protein n=1 Tax=Colletotrichum musicola TaxID=2175873 RepID=A0A8H6NSI7_9PEZI|nr:hypothetical protein CMUS01_03486 [Colletotrichum musicola]